MQIREAQKRVADLNRKMRRRPLDNPDFGGLWNHLREELDEIWKEYDRGTKQGLFEELADAQVLLLALTHSAGADMETELEAKMNINEQRTWTPPDEEGVIRHATDPRTPISDDGTTSDET